MTCNAGDKVYIIEYPMINLYVCERVQVDKSGEWIVLAGFCNKTVSVEEMGKTVFLSREEAEQALKERENHEKAEM